MFLRALAVITIMYDEVYQKHSPWFSHPENPRRLQIALRGIQENLPTRKYRIEKPDKAEWELIEEVHVKGYVEYIKRLSDKAPAEVDPDTYISKGTLDAALHAIGGLIKSVHMYIHGKGSLFLGLVRPPGHHAGKAGKAFGAPTQGFCIFNNIAVACKYLLDRVKLTKRICIIDFDVHHGNGTQEIFIDDPRVLHIDFHQDPRTLYPGTGFPEDIGIGEAEGTKINIILPPLAGDDIYSDAIEFAINIIEQFKPSVILFSAGFDAYNNDGLSNLKITTNIFHKLSYSIIKELRPLLIIASLEGGYSEGLRRGLPAYIKGLLLMDLGDLKEPSTRSFSRTIARYRESKERLKRILRDYWSI